MESPIVVDLPHSLGAAEAKRRIQGGIGRLGEHLPAGAQVDHGWTGDRMDLKVGALGQEVRAGVDVRETIVRIELVLPGFLSFFGNKVEALLRRHGGALLEDRTGGKKG